MLPVHPYWLQPNSEQARETLVLWQPHLVLAVSLAVAATAPSSAFAQPLPGGWPAIVAKANKDVLAYYPTEAWKAGLEGSATITCRLTPLGATRDCVLVSEMPVGGGFGQAALNIAAAVAADSHLTLTPEQADAPKSMTINFKLSPPSISPNLLVPGTLTGTPKWVRTPNSFDFATMYHEVDVNVTIGGKALMSCVIAPDGKMSACSVISETPSGAGFGRAALYLARYFRISPTTEPGYSVTGSKIFIPINFHPRN